MLQRVLINKAIEMLFQLTRHGGRSPGARALPHALRPLRRKARHPGAAGGMGQVARRGDGVDLVAGHALPDGVCPAQAPRLRGLLAQDIEGRQRLSRQVAVEGTQGLAPWARRPCV